MATTADSLAVGGNFLHALDLGTSLAIWELEGRIGVAPDCRYPAYQVGGGTHDCLYLALPCSPVLLPRLPEWAPGRGGGHPVAACLVHAVHSC